MALKHDHVSPFLPARKALVIARIHMDEPNISTESFVDVAQAHQRDIVLLGERVCHVPRSDAGSRKLLPYRVTGNDEDGESGGVSAHIESFHDRVIASKISCISGHGCICFPKKLPHRHVRSLPGALNDSTLRH